MMREQVRRPLSRAATSAPQGAMPMRRAATVSHPGRTPGPLVEPATRFGGASDFTSIPTHTREPPLVEAPDGGTAPTRADAGTPTFPTYVQITGDSSVSTTMAAAWKATKDATTRTSRREQGFWIKYDTKAASYDCTPTFVGDAIGNDETGAADPGTKPADSGTVYTVGLFHTHTPMTHRTGGTRAVGPSGADDRFHTSNNVVGIIYDYVESPAGSGTIPSGHPLNSAAKTYASGPSKRA